MISWGCVIRNMRVRFRSYLLLPPLLLLLALMVACDTASQPEIPATLIQNAPASQGAMPLPESTRMSMEQFTLQQQDMAREWDQFHMDFDTWRAGLTSCHRSSVQAALREFTVSFNGVTGLALDLPRSATTRELADLLIEASEGEEASLRQLRDRWQPNNISLFEMVEQKRSEAALAQKKAEDLALDLQNDLEEGSDPEEVAAVEAFSQSFEVVESAWEDFHEAYASLREAEMDQDALSEGVTLLIEQLNGIITMLDSITPAEATEEMLDSLSEAAEEELAALESLADILAGGDTHPLPPSSTPADTGAEAAVPGAIPTATPEPPSNGTTEPAMPAGHGMSMGGDLNDAYDEVDAAVNEAKDALMEISLSISAAVEGDNTESLGDLAEYNDEYRILVDEWDAFHQEYAQWRRTEGGCDRTRVLQSLDQFNLRVSELGRQVRGLPQDSYLLPMYTLLVESAEREEGALRTLRTSWRPFNVDVFKAVDQERLNADRLRRQAEIGLQELRERS